MSSALIEKLPPIIAPDTKVSIGTSTFLAALNQRKPFAFFLKKSNPNHTNRIPLSNLLSMTISVDKVREFRGTRGFMDTINGALGNHNSYPIVVAAIGIGLGLALSAASAGAAVPVVGGIAYSVIGASVDASSRNSNFRARKGDELWVVEQIGRVPEGPNKWAAMHVSYLFLIDPFRMKGNNREKGWLLHEQRVKLNLS